MQAGKLRHRVTFQAHDGSQNSVGELDPAGWVNQATRWASVRPLRGREFLESRALQSDVDTRIVTRYYEQARPDWRIVWNAHTYIIVSVIHPNEMQRETQFMCREVVS